MRWELLLRARPCRGAQSRSWPRQKLWWKISRGRARTQERAAYRDDVRDLLRRPGAADRDIQGHRGRHGSRRRWVPGVCRRARRLRSEAREGFGTKTCRLWRTRGLHAACTRPARGAPRPAASKRSPDARPPRTPPRCGRESAGSRRKDAGKTQKCSETVNHNPPNVAQIQGEAFQDGRCTSQRAPGAPASVHVSPPIAAPAQLTARSGRRRKF